MLSQYNKMWSEYKNENQIDCDVHLTEVRFDAPDGVEASFDLMEMLEGNYILHVTSKIHIYRNDFVRFLLWHEFTHLADFLTYPYEKPSLDDLDKRRQREENVNTAADRDIFGEYGEIHLPKKEPKKSIFDHDAGKKLFDYMNTFSEFHASQTALHAVLKHASPSVTARKSAAGNSRANTVSTKNNTDEAPGSSAAARMIIDVNKNQIPAPFKDISVRRLLINTLRRAHVGYQKFSTMLVPQVFVLYFRQIMYLFGYISFFGNDVDMLRQSFDVLGISDKEDLYLTMYRALKERDIDRILEYTGKIYNDSYLLFVKEYIRKHYDAGLYSEEELDEITPDNYHDFIETVSNRKGGRLWSGRVSPVYGVHDVDKAYGAVDVDTIKEIINKNRRLPGNQMKPDF